MTRVCYIGMCGHSMEVHRSLRTLEGVIFSGAAPGSMHEALERWFGDEMPYFSDYVEMLDIVKPDLCVVSPVYTLTGSVILACARRGIHVISEKPIAGSIEELQEVKRAVLENGIRFTAMHFLRFEPAFYAAGRYARSGRIGEVRLLTAQKSYKFGIRPDWFLDRTLYGGTIPWIGIHMIDMISWFTGKKYRTVHAAQFGNPERACLIQLMMEDDILASINLDYYRPDAAPTHGDDRIRAVGTKGIIEVRDGKIFLTDEDGFRETSTERILDLPAPDLVREFIAGKDPIPLEELFHITEAAIRAQEAADSGRTVQI